MGNKIKNNSLFNKFNACFCRFSEKIAQPTMRLQPRKSLLSILPSTSK